MDLAKRRFIRSSVPRDALYPKPNVFEVELLLMRAKRGDQKPRDILILSFYGLTASIAGRVAMRNINKSEDLLSIGYKTEIECIDRVIKGISEHDHNTLAKYIHKSVYHDCREFLKIDHVVVPPLNSKWLIDRAKELGDFEKALWEFQCVPYTLENDKDMETENIGSEINSDLCNVPLKDTYEDFVVVDLKQSEIFSDREKVIINMRLEGYTDEEIGKTLKLTKMSICKIRQSLYNRVLKVLGVLK